MRTLYSSLFVLLVPIILLRLLWRSIKAPEYRKRWGERFGCYQKTSSQGVAWFHAVSVGEAEAVFPLIKRLQEGRPSLPILLTTTTPTGSARVQAVLADSVQHVYLPYDIPCVVKKFLNSFKPTFAVVMETELWPNLFHACGVNNIPIYVINARLSEKSASGYRKLPALFQPLFTNITKIVAQTQDDAQRFVSIGAQPVQVSVYGNIKFDLNIPEAIIHAGKELKAAEFKGRKVLIAASTHRGEEQALINVYKAQKKNIPELLLVIVPRHPERFEEVADICQSNGLKVITRSSKQPCCQATDIYLADTMGELKMLYAAADVAFVGGSLAPVGGHNILEASAVGVPVLFGPNMANFKEITQKVLERKAAVQCGDERAIIQAVGLICSDHAYRNALIANGKAFVNQNRGAIDKLFELLSKELNP